MRAAEGYGISTSILAFSVVVRNCTKDIYFLQGFLSLHKYQVYLKDGSACNSSCCINLVVEGENRLLKVVFLLPHKPQDTERPHTHTPTPHAYTHTHPMGTSITSIIHVPFCKRWLTMFRTFLANGSSFIFFLWKST